MNPARAKNRGRRAARQTMSDRVDHLRPTGDFVDDGDGHLVPETTTVNGDVAAWIRPLPNQIQVVESGGQPVTLMAYDVLLPHATEDVQLDDLLEVTSSGQTDLDGRTLTVLDPAVGTHQIARRLMCRLQTGGA